MASLKDIAQATGFSLSTVSRVLNEDPRISAKTCQVVREAADRLGYRENVQAKALAGRPVRLIGFMASTLRYPWDGEVMRGVEDAAKAAGYRVLTALYFDDPERTETYRQLLEQPLFDGIVVGWSGWQWRKEGLGGKPVVYVDLWPERLGDARVVTSDHQLAAALLLDHFESNGISRVTCVGFGNRNTVESRRFECIRDACAERRLEFISVVPDAQGIAHVAGALSAEDALVVEPGNPWQTDSATSPSACLAAFFDHRPTELATLLPRAACVVQDHYTMGRAAVGVLTDLVMGNHPPQFQHVPVRLEVGRLTTEG